MSQANINLRIDPEIKKQAEAMFADMGLTMSTAINIFIRQTLRQGKIPFEITSDIPNAETLAAIDDVNKGRNLSKLYTDVDKMFEDILSEDTDA